MIKELNVLNLGAGVQSSTLYMMAVEDEIKIDVAIFGDTHGEPAAVYKHLGLLASKGNHKVPILVRSAGNLAEDLLKGRGVSGRFASIPAFTAPPLDRRENWKESQAGRQRRQCTKEYKIEVVERAIKRELLGIKPRCRVPKTVVVRQFFGISMEEARRAVSIRKRLDAIYWTEPVFPLLDKKMTRLDCREYLATRIPGIVPKSACTFCPYADDLRWLAMKEHDPESFAQAVSVDYDLRAEGSVANRGMTDQLWLSRACLPLDQVDFAARLKGKGYALPMFVEECEGVCGN